MLSTISVNPFGVLVTSIDNNKNEFIPYVDLSVSYLQERQTILDICDDVFKSGRLVLGDALWNLEASLSNYFGGPEVVALRSGTDALILALKAAQIGPGDEVITAPNSFIATAGAIVSVGAFPRFVDVNESMNIDPHLIEEAISTKTKAIIPVHLTGHTADMTKIMNIAKKHNLAVIEDAAQAIGAKHKHKHAGTFGAMGCFSAHPLKNLSALGDAGFLVINETANIDSDKLRFYRNHGLENRESQQSWGINCRLDVLQCRILTHRLQSLDHSNARRREIAKLYFDNLDPGLITLPLELNDNLNVFHTFTISLANRDIIKEALQSNGIGTAIHYPIPIHLQNPSRELGYKPGDFPVTERLAKRILSLPIQPHLQDHQIIRIATKLNELAESYKNEQI